MKAEESLQSRARYSGIQRILLRAVLCLCTLSLASCARYTCGVPDGKKCSPLGSVYRLITETPHTPSTPEVVDAYEQTAEGQPDGDDPLLARPRQLRVWIPAWVDAEGDLRGEAYLYLRLDKGRWLWSP